MTLIFVIITLSCFIFAYMVYRDILNPAFLLSGFWMVLGIFASLCLYDIYPPSDEAFLLCTIGAVCFLGGDLVASRFFRNVNIVAGNFMSNGKQKYKFRSKLYVMVVLAMLLFCSYRMITVVSMWRSNYTLNMIRLVYFGYNVGGYEISNTISVIELFIHLPFLYACMGIVAFNIVLPKKEKILNRFTIIISLVWIVMAQFITGGRMAIYIFAVELIAAFFMIRKIGAKDIKNYLLNHLRLIFFVAGIIIIIYYLSLGRQKEGTYDVLRAVYLNFCGSFTHMGLRMENTDFQPYTFGMSLLSGFLRPAMLIVKYTFGSFPELYQRTLDIGEQLQGAIRIGSNVETNAYVFPVYYFMYDLGYLGVIIDSFLCGFACDRVYMKYKRDPSLYRAAFYLLIIYAIFTSMIRYAGNLVYYALAFVMVRILFKKENVSG